MKSEESRVNRNSEYRSGWEECEGKRGKRNCIFYFSSLRFTLLRIAVLCVLPIFSYFSSKFD